MHPGSQARRMEEPIRIGPQEAGLKHQALLFISGIDPEGKLEGMLITSSFHFGSTRYGPS